MLRTSGFISQNHTIAGTLLCLFFSLFVSAAFANGNVHKNKYAAFVIDAHTGTVLYQENANKRLHPASLTKMMTLLMVFEALDQKKLQLHDRVLISSHAASMIPSKLDLPVGSTIKVKDAIHALTVKSANDVAVAMAEKLGGSEANFARMMTRKAQSLGMINTRFMNASGLHNARQISTARDMATLARTLLIDYEKYYPYFSKQMFRYRGKTYKSHNKLMKTYPGMDGFKTGYIRASGFNLVSSAVRDDNRLIGVVFGGKTGNLRNSQMKQVLDLSFERVNSTLLARVPLPQHKPAQDIQVAALSDYSPSAGEDNAITAREIFDSALAYQSRWHMLDSNNDRSVINRMIGQGDYDQDMRTRIETGLIGLSAHLKQDIPPSVWGTDSDLSKTGHWAIQIGAFSSRENTERALTMTLASLPENLKSGQSIIAPLETQEGWIYRARLQGYTKREARKACKALDECIPIAPHALRH